MDDPFKRFLGHTFHAVIVKPAVTRTELVSSWVSKKLVSLLSAHGTESAAPDWRRQPVHQKKQSSKPVFCASSCATATNDGERSTPITRQPGQTGLIFRVTIKSTGGPSSVDSSPRLAGGRNSGAPSRMGHPSPAARRELCRAIYENIEAHARRRLRHTECGGEGCARRAQPRLYGPAWRL